VLIQILRFYGVFLIVLVAALAVVILGWIDDHRWWWLELLLLPLTLLGLWNLLQHRHTLMRNYPLVAHVRWIFEYLRPFLRGYIVERDLDGRPYNREQRALVYERAKQAVDAKPFGTDLDVYDDHYELVTHSIIARTVENTDFRVTVGNDQCRRPFSASVFNISAMSFGALGASAIEALNRGAKAGGFYHDTGEGGISPYHRHGGDLVWEIGSGYFGCRDSRGAFDIEQFADKAQDDQVKMVEIKLSQGAKPGHGGVLPAAKVTAEIARTRQVSQGRDCISPPSHSAFSTPVGLLEFTASLRERSSGKPVGIKLCVGHGWELFAICKAMLSTGIRLDFIVVDGAEGGTGAAPEEFSDHVGMALREGLVIARNALVGTQLREDVRLAASGKMHGAFSLLSNMALGADWCNAARAFMFSLGCIQSKRCHTGRCPTGIATQSAVRQRGLVVDDKYRRVANYHRKNMERLGELLGAAGLDHPRDLRPCHLHHRLSPNDVATMDMIKEFLLPGQLLDDPDGSPYANWWSVARPDSFHPHHEP